MDDVVLARKYVKKADRAKKSGTEFTLSFSEYKRLMNRKTCAYSGLRFSELDEHNAWKNPWLGITLDRIDNSKGYIPGNVVPICNGINQLKSQWENPMIPLDEKMTIKIITKLALLRNKLDFLE
jgi:hypothetical protein